MIMTKADIETESAERYGRLLLRVAKLDKIIIRLGPKPIDRNLNTERNSSSIYYRPDVCLQHLINYSRVGVKTIATGCPHVYVCPHAKTYFNTLGLLQ